MLATEYEKSSARNEMERLFESFEVSDDELDFVAAAGDPTKRERKNKTERRNE